MILNIFVEQLLDILLSSRFQLLKALWFRMWQAFLHYVEESFNSSSLWITEVSHVILAFSTSDYLKEVYFPQGSGNIVWLTSQKHSSCSIVYDLEHNAVALKQTILMQFIKSTMFVFRFVWKPENWCIIRHAVLAYASSKPYL